VCWLTGWLLAGWLADGWLMVGEGDMGGLNGLCMQKQPKINEIQ